jgi:UDP-N-acetylglucosamine--N-acetylmuramyl-(pentapeptide) pyrophosphoryl-undecaprenol N-acetylglucosamine transferase
LSRTLLILAGGTGGHIMPGLAVADAMHARGWTIRWIGTSHGMETTLVPKAGWTLDTIAFAGLRGKGLRHALKGVTTLVAGLWTCFGLLGRIHPQAVLGMGGYVTVPGGICAALRGAPLVLMNGDAQLLLSNRALLPFAKRVLFGLPNEAKGPDSQANWTGCPVRAEIAAIEPPENRFANRSGPLVILVLGGSLGAAVINRIVPEAVARLPQDRRPRLVHQAGAAHAAALSERYRNLGIDAEVVPFIEDMARRYSEADVVLCRAGAMTVSELTTAGVASILVPLTVSTTSHQRENARYLERANAAYYLEQKDLSAVRLGELLEGLTRSRLLEMAQTARAIGKPLATQSVADAIEAVAKPEPST